MLSFVRCGLVLMALAGCGESADASDAGCAADSGRPSSVDDAGCPCGSTPVYGYRFDGPGACVDFSDASRREVIACLSGSVIATGVITCYQRPDGSRRVMTFMGYPALDDLGWTGCPEGTSARVSCP